jgi:hypothetical protein
MKMNKATSNRLQATSRQATKKKKMGEWVKGTSIFLYLVPCSLYLSKGFSQIRKKSAVIFLNLRHLSAYCISRHLEMSRKGLNMYNPLQAKRSWGYKRTTTLSELRSSSICYHGNHLNHSSEKRGRMGESTNGRMENNAYLFTHSLVYSSTDNTTLSSLRGTKQSRTMKHKRAYNDKGCKSIRAGILDCFATLAMTNSALAMTGSALAMTGSALAMTGSALAMTGSALAMTGSTLAMTGSTLAMTGSALAMTDSALAMTGSALAMTGSALAMTNEREGRMQYAPTTKNNCRLSIIDCRLVKGLLPASCLAVRNDGAGENAGKIATGINHDNHINHSSEKKGRMGEGTNRRKVQATSIFSWLACLLLVACSLLPYNNVIKSNL